MQENETPEAASTEETSEGTGSEPINATAAENTEDQTTPTGAENSSEESSAAVDNGDATAPTDEATQSETPEIQAEPEEEEEITYHAVQKEDSVTAIWEMQGRKHIRTIDPRSREGAEILRLFTAEEGEEASEEAGEAAAA